MKSILLLLFSITISASCGPQQYLTVASDELALNERNDLVMENDTIRVTYRFNAWNDGMTILIHNKSSNPVEIDWSRSALIVGERPYSFYSGQTTLSGNVKVDTVRTLFRSDGYRGDLNGVLTADAATAFLPPKASLTRHISALPVSIPDRHLFDTVRPAKYWSALHRPFKYRKLSFTRQSSPIVFRSFLTFGAGAQAFSVDHEFFVSEAWKSGDFPDRLPDSLQKSGNLLSK